MSLFALPAAARPTDTLPSGRNHENAVALLALPATTRWPLPAPVSVANASRSRTPSSWTLPLSFEPADERSPADADFVARGPGYSVFVGSAGAIVALQSPRETTRGDAAPAAPATNRRRHEASKSVRTWQCVRLRFDGANPDATPVAEQTLAGRLHRLVGSDPAGWQRHLPVHGRVRYVDVYPGIDVAFYGNGRELEYDFVVAPGASAGLPRLRFDGVRSVRVRPEGDLELDSGSGVLTHRRPIAYQSGPRGRETVEVAYRLAEDGSVGFDLGDYDRERTLVIDPVLSYATFVGGTGLDQCWDLAVDAAGAVYVAGETESTSLANLRILSTNAFLGTYQGGQVNVAGDAFVGKLIPDGTAFEWFTYLGGSDLDGAFTLALGDGGEPVIGGFTTSTNFPLSTNAYQRVIQGETNRFTLRYPLEAFVTRLKADGSGIVASTLFGAEGEEQFIDLAILADQRVVAVGTTTSTNLPQTGAPGYRGSTDGLLTLFTPDLSGVERVRYLGGSARDSAEGVVLDLTGSVLHVTGITESTNFQVVAAVQTTNAGLADAFLTGIGVDDGGVRYATYLGGDVDDYAYRVALDPAGSVWISGVTYSTNFPVAQAWQPTNAGASDGVLARFSADGRTLLLSTYYGGSADDSIWDLHGDADGRIHWAGETYSTSLPGVTTNSLRSTNAGLSDILLARATVAGEIEATFFGAPGDELAYGIAVDTAGNAYLAGRVRSVNFPVSSTNVAQAVYGGERTDGFVMKVSYEPPLAAQLAGQQLELSWPAPNPDFALETADAVGSGAVWSLVVEPVASEAGRHRVRLPVLPTNCVFRLRSTR